MQREHHFSKIWADLDWGDKTTGVPTLYLRDFLNTTLSEERQARYTYLTQRSSGVSRDGWTDHPPVPALTYGVTEGRVRRQTCLSVPSLLLPFSTLMGRFVSLAP